MQDPISGKVAVITGGTRGIGRAVAERLLAEGARVAICGRNRDSLDRAVQEMRAASRTEVMGEAADISRLEDASKFFRSVDAQLGPVEILVNNAGVGTFASVADLTPEAWHRVIDLNLNGAFYCSREALKRMRNGNGGYIINISSLAGKNAFAGGAAYNASKSALNAFSEAMMLDHRYEGIRVSYIMPGSVDTEFGGGRSGDWKIAPEDVAEVAVGLLRMPARTTVSRVEMRPSKPKK
ncbi:MAG TPA: SDR family oxidoreductase [Bryobacteraceae bacterium]|nr:SDR family oxidoreductase [Bryobacteraceae bacterium]